MAGTFLKPNVILMNGLRRKGRCYRIQKPVSKKITAVICSFLFVLFFAGCTSVKHTSYNPASKFPADKLKADLDVLNKILQANHPSLYWYTPKDSMDLYFRHTCESITDSLTEAQFKNKVAWLVAKINCGHTSVRSSKANAAYSITHKQNRFPLLLKTWNDSLVLLGSLNRSDTLLKRGTVITGIEQYSNRFLLDSMFQFISTDGYSTNFKSQAISFNFPLYYSNAFPIKDSFLIHYIDTTGVEQQSYVRLNTPAADTSKSKRLSVVTEKNKPSRKEVTQFILTGKRSMLIDTLNHLAYMRVATFSGGRLRKFFRQSFREINDNHISNLVIDLRENSGGSINMSSVLTRYIKNTSFHVADTAAAISKHISYSKNIHPALPYQLALWFAASKKTDGKIHFRELERHIYQPYRHRHYDGKVFLIQGGYTFSAAAMFVLQIKGQDNVTVTGEETGGGNYGASAVHLPEIILPHSGVRVVLPLYRLVFDHRQVKTGRGIQPDIYIPPSSADLKNGIDPKLQKIKALIQQQYNKH